MKRFFTTITLFVILYTSSYCITIADAQKSYVAGKWEEAATMYSKVCPTEPIEKQSECYLWNVLALSQIGNAKAFKEAGLRLDSLINNVNPQNAIYADLKMTDAQFKLYLGKYAQAAQSLIKAIETSKPQHVVVLKKVCAAVKAKTNSTELDEYCNNLDSNYISKIDTTKVQQTDTLKNITATDTINNINDTNSVSGVSSASAISRSSEIKQVKQNATDSLTKNSKQVQNSEYWTLQLGAFGTKANADLLISNLKKQNIKCTIVERPTANRILYLVYTGQFETREKAVDFAAKMLIPLKIDFQPMLKK